MATLDKNYIIEFLEQKMLEEIQNEDLVLLRDELVNSKMDKVEIKPYEPGYFTYYDG